MRLRSFVSTVFALSFCFAPSNAWADRVVLSTFIPKRGVTQENATNLFSLMSSELEFMSGVDEVLELSTRPPALTEDCMRSTRCLGTVTADAGGDTLITGTLESLGTTLNAHIVYYDNRSKKIVRQQSYEIPADPSGMVDQISPILVETLTGVNPKAAEAEASLSGVSFQDDDTLDFAAAPAPRPVTPPPPPAPAPRPITPPPAPAPRPVTPPPPPPADDYDFFDDDDARRTPAASEPTVQVVQRTIEAPAPPPPPAPAPPPPPASDDEFGTTFSFGSVSDSELAGPSTPPPAPPSRSYDDDEDFDTAPPRSSSTTYAPPRSGFDEDDDDLAPARQASTKPAKAGDDTEFRRAYISVRGGMSNYYVFAFGDVGAEVAVRAVGGLTFAVGLDVLIVRRNVLDNSGNPVLLTNMLYPVHFGILYRFKAKKLEPYVGFDGGFAKITNDPATGKAQFETTLRARVGLDYFFTKNFGINLDVGAGVMFGKAWPTIDPREKPTGFYPSGQIGFTFAF